MPNNVCPLRPMDPLQVDARLENQISIILTLIAIYFCQSICLETDSRTN